MLNVISLSKAFGPFQAVRDVSFTADKGEVLGFLGPNGAGKSTTMRMITGFLPPSSGTAVLNGHDVLRDPVEAKRQVGYLPENAPVYRDMNVLNFLRFAAEIRGFKGRERDARVDTAIEKSALAEVRHQSVDTLSKGYKQRACFAQAILHDPPILIMDEPTDGLDPNQKDVVRRMIRDMASEKAIVISTHILEEVDAVCTRAIIIANGAIVANGTPEELKAQSRLHGAAELIMETGSPDIMPELKSLPSAAEVRRGGDTYTVFARDRSRDSLFGEVTRMVRDRNWRTKGLRTLDGRLDEVFRKLTTGSRES